MLEELTSSDVMAVKRSSQTTLPSIRDAKNGDKSGSNVWLIKAFRRIHWAHEGGVESPLILVVIDGCICLHNNL